MNYETSTVIQLREAARTRPALRGSWIATATKGALIDGLKADDAGTLFKPPQVAQPAAPPTHKGSLKAPHVINLIVELIEACEEALAMVEQIDDMVGGPMAMPSPLAERLRAVLNNARGIT